LTCRRREKTQKENGAQGCRCVAAGRGGGAFSNRTEETKVQLRNEDTKRGGNGHGEFGASLKDVNEQSRKGRKRGEE